MDRKKQYKGPHVDYIGRTHRQNSNESRIPSSYDRGNGENRRISSGIAFENYAIPDEYYVDDPYGNKRTDNSKRHWAKADWPRQDMESYSHPSDMSHNAHNHRSKRRPAKKDTDRRPPRYQKGRNPNILLSTLAVFTIAVVVATPLLIIYVFGGGTPITEGTINLEIKLAEQFQNGMESPTSTVFKSTEKDLCPEVERAFTTDRNSQRNTNYACKLKSLRTGSIICTLVLSITGRYTIPDNDKYVQTITTYIGAARTLGSFTVIHGSIVVTSASYMKQGVQTIMTTTASEPTTTTSTPETTTTITIPPEMEMNDSITTPEEEITISCNARYAPSGWDNFSIVSVNNDDIHVTAFSNGTIRQSNSSYTARLQQSSPDMILSVLFPNTTTHCYARGSYVCSLTDDGIIVINDTATVIITNRASNLTLKGNGTVNEGDRYEMNCSGRVATEGGDLHLHVRSGNTSDFIRTTEVPIVTVGEFNDLCYQSVTKTYHFFAEKVQNGTEFSCVATNVKLSSYQTSSSIDMVVDFAAFNTQFHLQNTTWIPALGDKNSDEFKSFAEKIESDTDYVYERSNIKDNYKRSKVIGLEPGSVNVIFVMFIEIQVIITDSFNNVITTKLTAADIVTAFVVTLPLVADSLTESDLKSVETNSIVGQVIITDPDEDYECSNTKTDVVFLLDASGSIGSSNFILMKFFIKNITANILLDPTAIQVSVVTFASVPRYEFWLNEHYGALTLNPAIDSIVYTNAGTYIASGLQYVRDNALAAQNGARADSEKVIILMTDGVSSDNSATIASTLRNNGVLVACVGIGNGINTAQLNEIAYNSSYVFVAADFNVLTQIRDTVRRSTCETIDNNS
ncbi:uncharacterized protein LOC110464583 isoform X2 [Mizuhopecten yessoensis]|uniref:Collagen alpha-6(VI) chain n=1 Tax=Mizuhopecten yessoensis TaxID=6573 RepID=A0A210PTL2_MIZYE|nr:uncharacterized protein LOC110464583 isoform X1 [Mizuhopecten yessoensis]XP_021375538.1 uncharacterized protein LOC110464583 isoform X1 [Mizuhopecten yessoensis]XP_021375539.1 uncharacterized protein LOC110464583 isoform X1 [Mizuhopecten yessoensis]XP_021375541.1 uncharacterized protein LOC110464583 isoform X2 [Mizuhopecten yessoensis]OWF39823.1 Collagen alpha-6(VI) chain [Mizuhopecten yessoensis]